MSKGARMELLVSLDCWLGSEYFAHPHTSPDYTHPPSSHVHFHEAQILTCVPKFRRECVSLWDSHNVKFQNVRVICYARRGQQSYQSCSRRFAKSRILNRAQTTGLSVRHWHGVRSIQKGHIPTIVDTLFWELDFQHKPVTFLPGAISKAIKSNEMTYFWFILNTGVTVYFMTT